MVEDKRVSTVKATLVLAIVLNGLRNVVSCTEYVTGDKHVVVVQAEEIVTVEI